MELESLQGASLPVLLTAACHMARPGIIFLSLFFGIRLSWAINEDYGFRNLDQPDGTVFTVHKYIDELGRFLAVADGFVIQDPKDGYYYYAHIAEDGTVTPSRFKVGIDDDAEGLQSVLQHSDSALRGIRSRARDGEAEFPPIDLWVSHVYNENWLQPDGTPFTVERFMDEVGRYLRTEIGYVICHQEYGYCYYAQIAGDGTVTPSPFKAGIDDEAEKLEPVVQQNRYAVEELTSRYHNGEEIEAYVPSGCIRTGPFAFSERPHKHLRCL